LWRKNIRRKKMKGKKLVIYICFSILIILLSFVIYYGFSDVEKTNIQNVAFIFTIISEVLFFSMIYGVTRKEANTFIKAGISSVSIIYLIISLILNILIKIGIETVRVLVVSNIILLILYIAMVAAIYLFKKEK